MSGSFEEGLLGYVFHPDSDHGAIGYGRLDVALRPKPTGLHFDPSAVIVKVVMPNGHVQTATISYRSHSVLNSQRLVAGRILLHDHLGKMVEAFSFGGEVTVATMAQLTTCRITSTAPIIELTMDEPIPTLLVEEVEALLAHEHALLDQQREDFDLCLAPIEPSLLYCVCLAELQKKLSITSGVIAGHPEMRHLIGFLPGEIARLHDHRLCSDLVPSLAELF
jgi:hypothetical protein